VIEKTCPACGKRILVVRKEEGKGSVPLDPGPPTYLVNAAGRAELLPLEPPKQSDLTGDYRRREAMVTHFATCTDPGRFSR